MTSTNNVVRQISTQQNWAMCFLSNSFMGIGFQFRGAAALMAQPNHHLQTVYPLDYKTQTKLSGWIIYKIMDRSQFFYKGQKKKRTQQNIHSRKICI